MTQSAVCTHSRNEMTSNSSERINYLNSFLTTETQTQRIAISFSYQRNDQFLSTYRTSEDIISCIALYRSLKSSFRVIRNFLIKNTKITLFVKDQKLKIKCHRNLITSEFTITAYIGLLAASYVNL